MNSDRMNFPDTVEEFMDLYKIEDTRGVYTNGVQLIPIFRMYQWFEHEAEKNKNVEYVKYGHWDDDNVCSVCGFVPTSGMKDYYCSTCGAKMMQKKDENNYHSMYNEWKAEVYYDLLEWIDSHNCSAEEIREHVRDIIEKSKRK